MIPATWWDEAREGVKLDFDKAYGAQCVDLLRCYLDALGCKQPPGVEGARDLDMTVAGFRWLAGSEWPEQGDVAIWGATETNPYGHVAVIMAAGRRGAWFCEQNGFTQMGVVGRWREYAGATIWRKKS